MAATSKREKTFFVGEHASVGTVASAGEENVPNGRNSRKHQRKHHVSPHVPADRDSLLSDVSRLPEESFYGLVNLGAFILASTTVQLCVHNYKHHGFLVDWAPLKCMQGDLLIALVLYTFVFATSFLVFFTVAGHSKGKVSRVVLFSVYVAVQTVIATITVRASFVSRLNPVVSAVLTLLTLILHLKLHSYVMTNMVLQKLTDKNNVKITRSQSENLRKLLRRNSSGQFTNEQGEFMDEDAIDQSRLEAYPANITWKDFLYFLCIPSLVYEPKFPKRSSIRITYVLKQLLTAGLCLLCIYILGLQFIIPALQEDAQEYESQVKLTKDDVPVSLHSSGESYTIRFSVAYLTSTLRILMASCFEVIHLSVPSMIIWLTGFYALFHCMLNFLSEITMFGDRNFYQDWWNSSTLDEFWKKWNVPVHEWMHRHVFLESLKYGRSKIRATLLTFLISAILHEYLFILVFKIIAAHFAVAMLTQVPLILLSRAINNPRVGNILMWASLFAGQPLLELLYMRQYALENPGCLQFHNAVCSRQDTLAGVAAALGWT